MTITAEDVIYGLGLHAQEKEGGSYHVNVDEARILLAYIDAQAVRIAELEARENRVTKLVFDSSKSWHLLADKWAKAEQELAALREHVNQPYKLNSPVIPDGLIVAVNHLLDVDGSRGCYSAVECHDAREKVEHLLAIAPGT
ncbi:hypothetical protein LU604_17105 [Erwinia tracheiphila]|uniref:Ead/Ea22-like family protein n=1 Tax=Erwinia tracheiphila TaxID=65700 RepID=A0A345CP02_9GAMM|nr:hypothetical protein [Erwinia tracheiphila]AXF75169.1 hypothetical protein AV903_02085 [Erwinia tracheiphila]UIA82287.1 hypothetical protein LU604_17105 [Erwinia tracheiphila]UIA90882.1 hypothetical protein LU632_16690 [Erwinia tracheiphila]